MKKFSRNKTPQELAQECAKRCFIVEHEEYDKGSDFITINGVFADQFLRVLFNTVSGRFIVKMDGQYINERSDEYDGVPWYDEILELIYVKKDAA